ncbi:MAG: HTH-type transcriptional regulator/antitoxin HipB [Chlamydiales bacterium]|jgi:HTH-type transcriptional regulator/antitoxin HipB
MVAVMAVNDFTHIAKLILFHRKRAGLSRIQLAELAGIGKTAVYDVEHGKESVKLNTLIKILNTLNIQIHLNGPFSKEYEDIQNEKS